ncbi:MAG: hypothetical protein ACX93T_03915 [Bacteroidota bacterium]
METSAYQQVSGSEIATSHDTRAIQAGQKRKIVDQLPHTQHKRQSSVVPTERFQQDDHSKSHIDRSIINRQTGGEQLATLVLENEAYKKDYACLQAEHEQLRLRSNVLEKQNKAYEQQLVVAQQRTRELEAQNEMQAKVMMRWSVFQKAFGKASWSQHFGDVGVEPLLPDDIDKIWNSNCPFWPGKKVGDTHLLVLIPATVNGSPFTLNLLEELVSSPHITTRSYATRYRLYNHKVQKAYGDSAPGRSYWILMTKEILPSSRDKDYVAQQRLVADCAREHKLGYTLPGVLEATTAVLTHYVRSGKQLYPNDPSTYTRCSEQIDGPYPVAIGGFSDEGLHIHHTYHTLMHGFGASCLRKFCS